MRPSRAGKFIANILVNKETVTTKLDKNAALLEAFTERLTHKSTTIYSLGDNTY